MHLISADGTFNAGPSLGVIAWLLLIWTILAMGGVTAAKGQWTWFVVGIVTGGMGWISERSAQLEQGAGPRHERAEARN